MADEKNSATAQGMVGSGGILGRRALNRATLARQMLLERETVSVPGAVSRLAGLQAQVASPPYIGIWTRLRDFRREDLTESLEQRQVVRAALMRSTLHLMSAEDFLLLRGAIQPALVRGLNGFFGKRAKDLDVEKLVAAAKESLEERPLAQGGLRDVLSEVEPGRDAAALAYTVRAYLPMVQIPSGGRWGYSNRPPYALPESWLGSSVSKDVHPRELLRRYLAAFGPATVQDAQAWAGLTRLKEAVEALKPELSVFKDERGRELLDLLGAPLPSPDTPAPVRFVPEYDNLVLSHADRTRVIADEYRKAVFLTAGRVRATFLVDGFVAGAWKIEKSRNMATLVIEPFVKLSKQDRDSLTGEGEKLVRFVGDDVKAHSVRFEMAG